jgi:hypothetical protein
VTTKLLLTIIAAAVVAAGAWWLARSGRSAAADRQTGAAETIQASGKILGLAIGDPVDEARKRLDPLREPVDYTPDAKEKSGRRIYWKLRETEFQWVIVWGNAQGRITRIRGYYRVEQRPAFSAIGDIAAADTVTPQEVKWTLRRPGAPYFRVIAQGAEQQAHTVYMFSLELPDEQQQLSRSGTPPVPEAE